MNEVDRDSLVNMAVKRARDLNYRAPHEIRQDLVIFKEYGVTVPDTTVAGMEILLRRLVAEQSKTRLIAKRRQASARAGRAIKKGPKVKVPKEERKKGGRGR